MNGLERFFPVDGSEKTDGFLLSTLIIGNTISIGIMD